MQQQDHYQIALRNRELMLEQGLDPELCVKFIEQTITLQRINYEIIAPTLQEEDREQILIILMQGELLLDIIRRSCPS